MSRNTKASLATLAFVLPLLVIGPAPAAQQTTIGQDLVSVRARYGSLVSRAELGKILNEVTWIHRDEGYGMLGKSGGNVCPQPVTQKTVSCDWIVNQRTGKGGDVFGSATNDDGSPAPGVPGFNQNETFSGTFVAPVEPESGGANPPPPPPPPNIEVVKLLIEMEAHQQELLTKIDALTALLSTVHSDTWATKEGVSQLLQKPGGLVDFPIYKGRVLGQPFTLTPQK